MQGITTSTRAGIVERFSKIIAAEEPFETTSRSALPVVVMGKIKSFETGRHGCIGFERLLIEPCAFLAPLPETIAADWRKLPGITLLGFNQPAKRLQTCLKDLAARRPMTTEDHRVRKFGVIVGGDRLEPLPFLRAVGLKQIQESRR